LILSALCVVGIAATTSGLDGSMSKTSTVPRAALIATLLTATPALADGGTRGAMEVLGWAIFLGWGAAVMVGGGALAWLPYVRLRETSQEALRSARRAGEAEGADRRQRVDSWAWAG
jgi:hypothetical protein